MKRLFLTALVACAAAFAFPACHEDDEEPDDQKVEDPKDPDDVVVREDVDVEADTQVKSVAEPDFSSIFGTLLNPFVNVETIDNEAVDLGLPSGTKWASKNVGASSPWDLGDFYAWADPVLYYTKDKSGNKTWKSGKTGFNTESYKFYKNGHYVKYKISVYGDDDPYPADNLYDILPEDDPANVNWGNGWFTPSQDEIKELQSCCQLEWTANYNGKGVAGMLVTGPNGKSIFLPHGNQKSVAYNSYYMATTVRGCMRIQNFDAHSLCFSETDMKPSYDFHNREWGSLVRAVQPPSSSSHVADAVDLGLPSGVLWASHNVGADSPQSRGDLLAWGETMPHYDIFKSAAGHRVWRTGYEGGYTEENYRWYQKTYPSETLRQEDDAAHAYWGGKWRTPSLDEMQELQKECKWEYVSELDGKAVKGFKVTGPNGAYIFMPTTSLIRNLTESSCTSSTAIYQTSKSGRVFYWYAGSDVEQVQTYITGFDPECGTAIRPVMDK